jgi:hypothetical protein
MILSEEVKELHSENYKHCRMILKKILEDGKTSHIHGSAELIL